MQRYAGLPDAGIPPRELPVTDTNTIDDDNTRVGCHSYSYDLCPPEDWNPGPPFVATCTITTTDGNSYSWTVPLHLVPA